MVTEILPALHPRLDRCRMREFTHRTRATNGAAHEETEEIHVLRGQAWEARGQARRRQEEVNASYSMQMPTGDDPSKRRPPVDKPERPRPRPPDPPPPPAPP